MLDIYGKLALLSKILKRMYGQRNACPVIIYHLLTANISLAVQSKRLKIVAMVKPK